MCQEENKDRRRTCWNTYQPKIWNFLEIPDSSVWAKLYGFVALLFVVLSIFSFFADTTDEFATYMYAVKASGNESVLNAEFNISMEENITFITMPTPAPSEIPELELIRVKHPSLHIIDMICLVFFTIEYVARLVFAPQKFKFVTSTMGVIDFIAILPDIISLIVVSARPELMFSSEAMEVVSFFRIVRVLRIFRLVKHVPGLWILVYTLKASVGELILLSCFMIVGILVFSSLIFFADTRANFESIPHAFWWALITMTTVGYGDMYPTTTLGKLVGSLCAMSGLLMIGFSVPTLVNNFTLYYKHLQFALNADKEGMTKNEHSSKHWHYASAEDKESCTVTLQTDRNDNKTEGVPLMTIETENRTNNENGNTVEVC